MMNSNNNNQNNSQNEINQNAFPMPYDYYADESVMPYEATEIPLPPNSKQYLGLAGIFSSSLGYPTEPIHYISLTTLRGQTLDFEVCYATFQALKQQQAQLSLSQAENLWLWVSVESGHELENWRLFKSDLPNHLIQSLYEKAQHFETLLNLLELIQGFKTQVIKDFAQSLLYNENLMASWLSIPASKRHHHSFPGGLMVHSLEVAQMVKHNLSLIENEISVQETEVTILAALLHDIGKTQTLTIETHTELGRLVDHEKLTLLVLAEPLSRLKAKWSKGAITLQYLITWKTSAGFCKFIGGEMIKNADQLSTKLSLRRMGFSDKPDYYNYAKVMVGGQSVYLNRI
ncbi:HDIG domain-containing metalloprotein [Thiosulfativibrio zosterae]|uniref:Uncharacterized domain-containing protein n=1 Tax=Thiosulfativibrio zosterae TaxID=2675053 RepID=A0A6F8PR81_9GAMM|nr:TraI domain-containing protein [Thiosulfativibrio zosterae]BBP44537.1 hypothetical protein THMIRHAT_22830 [Thiosulfativibrio zosterae]